MAVGSPERGDQGSVVVVEREADPAFGLAGALDAAGLDSLVGELEREDRHPPTVTVLVGLGAVVFTDPRIVAQLADRVTQAQRGARVVLLGAVPPRDRDLGWSVASLAARHGFLGMGIADPLEDLMQSGFPEQSVHHGRPVSRAWVEADLRIVLAPCATDAVQGFVGCLEAFGGLAPPIAGAKAAEVIADLMAHAAPDLAVLDATTISHGPVGTSVRRELRANALVAGQSAVLVDVVAGSLLGMDPAVSSTVSACLSGVGLPRGIEWWVT